VLHAFTNLWRLEHPHCSFDAKEFTVDGVRARRTVLTTPAGSLTEEVHYSPALGSPARAEHYVKSLEDYEILQAYLRDCRVVPHDGAIQRCERELGERGLSWAGLQRTPYQQMWIQWACIEDLALHMADAPDLVDEILRMLGAQLRETMRITREAMDRHDVMVVNFPDNITAPMIGDRLFRKHALPFYREMADLVEDRGAIVAVHMDGDLRSLADAIRDSGVRGLDSFTPPPDCDTSVADAVALWPGMRLFVNVPSSVHLGTPEKIRACVTEMLEQGAHTNTMWIQISEDVPKFRWRESFPAIVEAIHAFGVPVGT